jgi:hypothetical protein
MKQTRLILLLQICCLLTIAPVSAQVKNNVAKIHAFVRETTPGNVQVDANGDQTTGSVDHLHYLYAETTGKVLPQWNVLYTRSGTFAIQADEVDSAKVTVGRLKNSARVAYLTHKKGNRLWKLTLVPIKARIPANISALLSTNEAVLITQFGRKQFTHAILKETQLETIRYE